MLWRFEIILADIDEMSDALTDALFEAGCADGTPWSSAGRAGIGFSREAPTLDDAIRSAVSDVRKTGCEVQHVDVDIDQAELREWLSAV